MYDTYRHQSSFLFKNCKLNDNGSVSLLPIAFPNTPPVAHTILNKAQMYTNRIWLVIVHIFTPNSYKVNNDRTHLNMMKTGEVQIWGYVCFLA